MVVTMDETHSHIHRHSKCDTFGLHEVERLVGTALAASPNYEPALAHEVKTVLHEISGRLQHTSLVESRESMMDALDALETLFTVPDNLPSGVVFELHSYIGLLNLYLDHLTAAQTAFVKALWVATSSSELDASAVPRTLHRLGIAYAGAGDTVQARSLLRKALAEYDRTPRIHHNARYKEYASVALRTLNTANNGALATRTLFSSSSLLTKNTAV